MGAAVLSDDERFARERRRQLRAAARRASEATVERDRLIREERAAGGTLRAIGELVGLSHVAVQKICARP